MAGKRLTFTIDDDTFERLKADLGGESADEWVRDAIRRKLGDDHDDYDEPLEFVDDCAI